MSTPLGYRLRIENEAGDADFLVLTSLRTGPNSLFVEPPQTDGSTLDPVAGKVTVGATTILVADGIGEIEVTDPSTTGDDDDFEGYADTAALAAFWQDRNGQTAHTFALNTTDGVGGSQCAEISITTTNTFLGGGAGRFHTYTGLTPGATYTATLVARRTSANVNHRFILSLNPVQADLPNDTAEHTLTVSAVATNTGTLTASFGYAYDSNESAPPARTVFDDFTLTGLDVVGPRTVTGRIVTAALGDLQGRQQLLSRLAYVEETEDEGDTWGNLTTGYVNNIRLVDAITYEFTIGESKRIEQASRVFDRISDPVDDPDFLGIFDRASCIIGGPIIGDFGPTHDRGRPVFRVTQTTLTQEGDTFVALQFESGFLYHGAIPASQTPVDQLNRDFFDSHAKDYLDETAAQHAATVVLLAPLANVVVRIYDAGTGAWIADHDGAMEQIDLTAFRDWRFITEDGTIIARWHGVAPAIGTRYQLAVFPTEMSEKNPIHLTGHPVWLDTQLSKWKGIAYNQDSADAVTAAIGADMLVNLRVTAGETFEEWVTKNLRGPFGFTVRTNASGEREYITTRIRPAAVPTTVITNDELISSDGDVFHVDEESAAIKVVFQSLAFRTMTERLESTPIDAIQGTKVTVELDGKKSGKDVSPIFGDREIQFEIPGQIAGLYKGTLQTQVAYNVSATDPGATGALSFWLDTSGGTTIETGAILKRRDLGNGSWIEWNDIHTPITTTAELLAVIASQVSAGSLDLWVVGQYACLFDWQGHGEITGEILVRRDVMAELVGDEIVLDLAHNPTGSPDQIPSMQRGTVPRRYQILRRSPAPEGQKLLVKDRGPAEVDGAVTPPVFITCGDIDPPTGIAVDMVGTTATVTWVNGDATLEVEVSIRLASDDSLIVIAVLPAGSTTYTFTLPSELTEYTFAVRHVDAPPLHCTSDTDEVNATTGGLQSLQPPIDPAAFADGKGTFGLEVTPTEPAANIEFWFAAETEAGSGIAGAYLLYATKASLAGRTSAETGIAPNDGTLRYLIARHVESGFTPSDFTTPVSINPWLLIPPVDPVPPVVPPVGIQNLPTSITLITGSVPLGIRELPEVATRMTPWRGTEDLAPLAGVTAVEITASILSTTAPVGGYVAIQYQHPCSCDWDYLDGVGGPVLPLDEASLDLLDTCAADVDDPWVVAGVPVLLVDDAKTDVRLRAVVLGGTETEDVTFAALRIRPTTIAPDIPNDEAPDPPPEFPDPCVGGGGSEGFEGYADDLELLADWTLINLGGWGAGVHLDLLNGRNGGHCLRMDNSGGGGSTGPVAERLLTGLVPASGSITFQGWYRKDVPNCGQQTAPQAAGVRNADATQARGVALNSSTWVAFDTNDAGGCPFTDGEARIRVGWGGVTFGEACPGSVYFDDLTVKINGVLVDICSGGGGGTGIGDDGNDPVPPPPPGGYPPPPVGGTRPFMIHNISAGGLGFWNGTVSILTAANTPALMTLATANGSKNCYRHGGDAAKLDAAGRFSYPLWEALVLAVYNDPTARAALEAAIAAGSAWRHFLLDEPFHPRWGGISLQTMDRMATFSKSLYPTWGTLFRMAPNDSRLTRAIVNCDTYWSEYNLSKGDPAAYRDAAVAAAEAMGKGVVMGIHYGAFPIASSTTYITPDQLEHYGSIIWGSTSPAVAAAGGWKYITAMNGQAGFPQTVQRRRDAFAALDP